MWCDRPLQNPGQFGRHGPPNHPFGRLPPAPTHSLSAGGAPPKRGRDRLRRERGSGRQPTLYGLLVLSFTRLAGLANFGACAVCPGPPAFPLFLRTVRSREGRIRRIGDAFNDKLQERMRVLRSRCNYREVLSHPYEAKPHTIHDPHPRGS